MADNEQFGKPRQLEHFYTFKNKGDPEEAVAEHQLLNFEAEVAKRGLFKSLVYVSHVSALQDQSVTSFLTTLVGVAERHSGIYDGFGAFTEV